MKKAFKGLGIAFLVFAASFQVFAPGLVGAQGLVTTIASASFPASTAANQVVICTATPTCTPGVATWTLSAAGAGNSNMAATAGQAFIDGAAAGSIHLRAAGSTDLMVNPSSGGVSIGTGVAPSTGTLNNGLEIAGLMRSAGLLTTTAQFDATTTTLANITGLVTPSLTAGKTYNFRAVLQLTPDTVGGQKIAIAGTATATTLIAQVNSINNTTNANILNSRLTSLGSSAGVAGGTTDFTTIDGTIIVNAGGTLAIQFAQNAANGTSSVLIGSSLQFWPVN